MTKETREQEATVARESVLYFGIDFHKEVTEVAVIAGSDGRVVGRQKMPTNLNKIRQYIEKQSACCEAKAISCYEASCCGYGLHRHLMSHEIRCEVIAPHTVEKSVESRQKKNDKVDAIHLARQLRSGGLKLVRVPGLEHERVRRYVRMANDIESDCRRIKAKISLLLLNMGIDMQDIRCEKWSRKYRDWLKRLELSTLDREVLSERMVQLEYLEIRMIDIVGKIKELIKENKATSDIGKLMSLKGIGLIGAATLWSEIYDFKRFGRARSYMGYNGLDCYEHSSGGIEHRGHITKLGNSRCRKVAIQAAMAYRSPPKMSDELKKRQSGQPAAVVATSWMAQKRLHKRYWYLLNKKGSAGKARVAVAREVAGFIWAIMQIDEPCNEALVDSIIEKQTQKEMAEYKMH